MRRLIIVASISCLSCAACWSAYDVELRAARPGLLPSTLRVEPLYPQHADWNSYAAVGESALPRFDQGDLDCAVAAAPGRCGHAGERRQVALAGLSSCAGLALRDALGVFFWRCVLRDGAPTFVSAGFRPGKGLADLLGDGAWLPNHVTLRSADGQTARSRPEVWWRNPVLPLPDNRGGQVAVLQQEGAVYLLETSRFTPGYNLDADRVAFVVKPPAVLALEPGAAPSCHWEFTALQAGEAAEPNALCLLAAGGQDHLWIEGRLVAGGPPEADHALLLANNIGTRLHRVSVAYGRLGGIELRQCSGVVADQLLVANAGREVAWADRVGGLTTFDVEDCLFTGLRLFNNHTAIYAETWTRASVFHDVLAVNNVDAISGVPWVDDHFVEVTVARNQGIGYENLTSMNWGNTFVSFLAANDADGLYLAQGTGKSTLVNVASAHNARAGLRCQPYTEGVSYAPNRVHGVLMVGDNGVSDCALDGTGPGCGFLQPACTGSGGDGSTDYGAEASDAVLRPGLSLRAAFVGPVADRVNRDGSGPVGYAPDLDWLGFANRYRAWGRDTGLDGAAARGPCLQGDCRVWDWRLAAGDAALAERSGDGARPNAPFVDGAPCPPEVHGDEAVTDQTEPPSTFLIRAAEILLDDAGDEDGLCESGERCRYSPHLGAYQGEGDPEGRRCSFEDGLVAGVEMYAYERFAP